MAYFTLAAVLKYWPLLLMRQNRFWRSCSAALDARSIALKSVLNSSWLMASIRCPLRVNGNIDRLATSQSPIGRWRRKRSS